MDVTPASSTYVSSCRLFLQDHVTHKSQVPAQLGLQQCSVPLITFIQTNPFTSFLTETDSLGVLTGMPTVATSQPNSLDLPPPALTTSFTAADSNTPMIIYSFVTEYLIDLSPAQVYHPLICRGIHILTIAHSSPPSTIPNSIRI